jgi:alkylation response protein AidB-like acyl-CoA dehydrogenase
VDFELKFTPELERFRQRVQDWLKANIPDGMENPADPVDLTPEGYRKQRELGRKMAELGWLYPTYPKEYGGGGLSDDEAIIIETELDRFDQLLPPYYDSGGKLAAATITVWGTEEQKRAFLPPILTGQVRSWQLLTEPDAGSDLANVKTTAIRDGDHYVVNGQKIFVGSAHGAEWSWMIANTNPNGKRHENLSWFVLPMDLPGVTWTHMDLIFAGNESGALSGYKNTVYLEDVRIPAFNLVGGENNGWKVAGTHLELEHGLMQGSLNGDRTLQRVFKVCRDLKREGRPLLEHDDVREELADLYIDSELTRLLHLRNYWMRSAKKPMTYEGPQAYLHMKRAALRTSKSLHKILGPYALTLDKERGLEDGHIEVQQRGSIVAQHPGGTVEIQKIIIARRLGIGRAVKEQAGVLR